MGKHFAHQYVLLIGEQCCFDQLDLPVNLPADDFQFSTHEMVQHELLCYSQTSCRYRTRQCNISSRCLPVHSRAISLRKISCQAACISKLDVLPVIVKMFHINNVSH